MFGWLVSAKTFVSNLRFCGVFPAPKQTMPKKVCFRDVSAKSLSLPKKGLFPKVSFSAQNKRFFGELVCFLGGGVGLPGRHTASPHIC